MIEKEIYMVQQSWNEIKSKKDPEFNKLFCSKLFEISEEIKDLFKTEDSSQSKRFVSMLDYLNKNSTMVELYRK